MVKVLGIIMAFCYNICKNYGIAIILFTFISKIVLLPISIWVQKNSIKMVKMQPDINKIKIKYFGDKDKIADEQSVLYKKEKYNAFASLIPLLIQILLLMGLVNVINHPLDYIIKVNDEVSQKLIDTALLNHEDLDSESSSLELVVVNDIKNDQYIEDYEEAVETEIAEEELDFDKLEKDIKNLNLDFCGFDLSWVAVTVSKIAWLIPLIAGFSAWLLCLAQNAINVLQAEQSKANKYSMMAFSVSLSLYLGSFVPAGVALYWTASNILAIIQQYILNYFIDPKKYVDYENLQKTSKELKELENSSKLKQTKEQKKKERDDYKRFFSIVNKHLVFYSEGNGFYKYYKGMIEYILNNTNITIHYITSDYNDNIFNLANANNQIKAYYIAERKLITLMMKMDADVVVMTMPDLDNYHIKKSYLRKDIEYVYIPHGMDSLNMTMREKSMNAYDTIFVTNKYQREELEKIIKYYNLKDRKIFNWGYGLLDEMINDYNKNKVTNKQKTVLIAPSWQKDNIVDLCLDEILEYLKGNDYKVIVRPHPQHVRHMAEKFEAMKKLYENDDSIEIQTDFSKNDTVFSADLMISDWSGIAYEYAYTTKKPVLFINTPMKIMNPEYKKIDVEPINIWSRKIIGEELDLENLKDINKIVNKMLKDSDKYKKQITELLNDSMYNLGTSDSEAGEYLISAIQKQIERKKEKR